MFPKIIAAMVPSESGRRVFEKALALAKKANASLMLLHVLSPEDRRHPVMPTASIPYSYPVITEDAIKRYQEEQEIVGNRELSLLQGFATEAASAGVNVELFQKVGDPSRIICDIARNWDADLVVKGRQGRTGLSELLLSSVSSYVTHYVHCSVLIVQGRVKPGTGVTAEAQSEFAKILVALENTEERQSIFDRALFLAKASGAHLMLLHVLSPFDESYDYPMYPDPDIYPALYDEVMKNYMPQLETFEQKGLEFLRSLRTKAMDAGVPTELTQSLGDPGQIICHIADTWGAELIVIGRRCRTGLNELILGSASNYVLHHAPCSVLISQRCK